MIAPSIEACEYYTRSGLPVYYYTFNHREAFAVEPWHGSFHSIELGYLFGSTFKSKIVEVGKDQIYTNADRGVARNIMKLWADFAIHGYA